MVLWSNLAENIILQPTTISVPNLSKYNFLRIIYTYGEQRLMYNSSIDTPIIDGIIIQLLTTITEDNKEYSSYRELELRPSSNEIIIGDGKIKLPGNTKYSVDNYYGQPRYIIGYKIS